MASMVRGASPVAPKVGLQARLGSIRSVLGEAHALLDMIETRLVGGAPPSSPAGMTLPPDGDSIASTVERLSEQAASLAQRLSTIEKAL